MPRSRVSRTIRTLRIPTIVLLLVLLIPGCAGLKEARSARVGASALRDALAAESARWEAQADAAARLGDASGEALARQQAARLAADAASADRAVRRLDRVLTEGDHLERSGAFNAVAGAFPEPFRAPLLLGAAALAAAWRARQLKLGLASVAESFDKAMRDDPELAARLKVHAPTLRTIQTRAAQRVIDEATRSETMLRLPL